VLHLFDGDNVAEKVLGFCKEIGLSQATYASMIEFVKRRAAAEPLMTVPFDTAKGTQVRERERETERERERKGTVPASARP
jgi:hypothetical protein